MYMIDMNTNTWNKQRETLPPGLSGTAVELIRLATAPARHQARVDATIEAALQAVCAEPGVATRRECRLAEVLCAIDLHGRGGGLLGRGMPSTSRLAAFGSLGSGRRNAGDGAAYMAALAEAERLLGDYAVSYGPCRWHGRDVSGPACRITEQAAVAFLGRRVLWDESSLAAREYARMRLAETAVRPMAVAIMAGEDVHERWRSDHARQLIAWDRCYQCLGLRGAHLPTWLARLCRELCADTFDTRHVSAVVRAEMERDLRATCGWVVSEGISSPECSVLWSDEREDGTQVCTVVAGSDIVRVHPTHVECDRM
jgi:hypothetical protein